MIAVIDKATTDLATELDKAGKVASACLETESEEAVIGAGYIGEALDACLAG